LVGSGFFIFLVFNKELASFEGLEYKKGNFFRPVFLKEKKKTGWLLELVLRQSPPAYGCLFY
jgi:hypothetical protein